MTSWEELTTEPDPLLRSGVEFMDGSPLSHSRMHEDGDRAVFARKKKKGFYKKYKVRSNRL
jgi:hypothetical protein